MRHLIILIVVRVRVRSQWLSGVPGCEEDTAAQELGAAAREYAEVGALAESPAMGVKKWPVADRSDGVARWARAEGRVTLARGRGQAV